MSGEHGSAPGLLDCHVERLLGKLRSLGYADCKMRDRRQLAARFVRWTQAKRVAAIDLTESHIVEHLACVPKRSPERRAFKKALLRRFLQILRDEGVVVLSDNTIGRYSGQFYSLPAKERSWRYSSDLSGSDHGTGGSSLASPRRRSGRLDQPAPRCGDRLP